MAPDADAAVPGFWRDLGLPGLYDIHVHFLPPNIQRAVWSVFDAAGPKIGRPWPISEIRVVDDDGRDVPAGTPGTIYLKMLGSGFEYKGDAGKTRANRLADFFTVGDVGHLTEDGYLFLDDRKADNDQTHGSAAFGDPALA